MTNSTFVLALYVMLVLVLAGLGLVSDWFGPFPNPIPRPGWGSLVGVVLAVLAMWRLERA